MADAVGETGIISLIMPVSKGIAPLGDNLSIYIKQQEIREATVEHPTNVENHKTVGTIKSFTRGLSIVFITEDKYDKTSSEISLTGRAICLQLALRYSLCISP
jgi:hypothetical protein